MIAAEAERPDRIDFVLIVTPNVSHYPIARLALERGFHVVCDKPLTRPAATPRSSAAWSRRTALLFCVTYTYRGYPIVQHMRDMIAPASSATSASSPPSIPRNGWPRSLEKTGQKQAALAHRPQRAGHLELRRRHRQPHREHGVAT